MSTGGDTRRSAVRGWHRVATTSVGAVAIVVTGAVAAVGGMVGVPRPDVAPAAQQVGITPPPQVAVCPGPARLTDPAKVGDAEFGSSPVGTRSAVRAVADGAMTVSRLDGEDARTVKPTADTSVVTVKDPVAGTRVVATSDGDRAWSAGSIGSITAEGDLRGLTAATCTAPGISQWLVGGSTEVGSSAQLVVQNPGLTPATVEVEVWGQGGRAVLGAGSQHLVAPGEEIRTLVEAAAPEQRRMVVRVTSTGGLVAAYLQHTTLDGLVPLGADFVVPGAEPGRALVVSGIVSTGEAVEDPHAPQLRLLAPGDAAATVSLNVYGEDGPVDLRGVEEVDLDPGVVTDVSMGGLPAGTYTVVARSATPVVAGAYQDREGSTDPELLRGERAYDRAWIASRTLSADDDRTTGVGQVALVPGTTSTVTLAAVPRSAGKNGTLPAGEVRGTLRAYDDQGKVIGERRVVVPTGTTMTVAASAVVKDGVRARPAVLTLDRDEAAGPAFAWNVLVTAGPPADDGEEGSLVSVLVPATKTERTSVETVAVSTRLGTGD